MNTFLARFTQSSCRLPFTPPVLSPFLTVISDRKTSVLYDRLITRDYISGLVSGDGSSEGIGGSVTFGTSSSGRFRKIIAAGVISSRIPSGVVRSGEGGEYDDEPDSGRSRRGRGGESFRYGYEKGQRAWNP